MQAKTVFQYSIYPVVMILFSGIILTGIYAGYNYYLVSLPVIFAAGLLVAVLERFFPYQEAWLDHWDWNLDIVHYLVNFAGKLLALLNFSMLAEQITFPQLFPTEIPFLLQVLLALVAFDFIAYLTHLISHKSAFLWKFHAIHHSSERLYFLNGEKRHALHQVFEGFPGLILCLVIGTPYPVMVSAISILTIGFFFAHTNLDYKAGFLKHIFCVAEVHRWHHRTDFEEGEVNFGALFSVWDHIFGTAYSPKDKELKEVGIKEEPNFPRSFMGQFFYPFSRSLQERSKK